MLVKRKKEGRSGEGRNYLIFVFVTVGEPTVVRKTYSSVYVSEETNLVKRGIR